MDAKKDQRQTARVKCSVPAKIAYYVPLEYEACYGPSCFRSTIVDASENGFGLRLEAELAANTVVNVFPYRECDAGESRTIEKVYPATVKWVKTNTESRSSPFRIGVQYIV